MPIHVAPTSVGPSGGSYPKWGLATGFPSQTLLFTHLTPLIICIFSDERWLFLPSKFISRVTSLPHYLSSDGIPHCSLFPRETFSLVLSSDGHMKTHGT